MEDRQSQVSLVVGRDTRLPLTQSERRRARAQQTRALVNEAENQCPHCGSYRLDGAPPLTHEVSCARHGRFMRGEEPPL